MAETPLWIANIRQLLAARGWSQLEFAKRVGVDKNTISNILLGKTSPSVRVLEDMTGPKALDVPMYRLFVDAAQASAIERHDRAESAAGDAAAIKEQAKLELLEEMARGLGRTMATLPTPGPVAVPAPVPAKRSRKRA